MRSCAFDNQFKTNSGLVFLLLPPLSSVYSDQPAWFRTILAVSAESLSGGHHVQALAWWSSWGRV